MPEKLRELVISEYRNDIRGDLILENVVEDSEGLKIITELLDFAYETSIRELEERKKGIVGEATISQLEKTIIPELEEMKLLIKGSQLPLRNERYLLSFANAFKVWGWDMQYPTELFILLLKLNETYKTL